SVLVPNLLNEPLPEMTPPYVWESERLKASVAPFEIETFPATEPLVPPLPNCKVPALMVVLPVYVLFPVSVSVPLPDLVSAPAPETTPDNNGLNVDVLKVPAPVSATLRALVNALPNNRVPPLNVRPLEALPRLLSAATCNEPA